MEMSLHVILADIDTIRQLFQLIADKAGAKNDVFIAGVFVANVETAFMCMTEGTCHSPVARA